MSLQESKQLKRTIAPASFLVTVEHWPDPKRSVLQLLYDAWLRQEKMQIEGEATLVIADGAATFAEAKLTFTTGRIRWSNKLTSMEVPLAEIVNVRVLQSTILFDRLERGSVAYEVRFRVADVSIATRIANLLCLGESERPHATAAQDVRPSSNVPIAEPFTSNACKGDPNGGPEVNPAVTSTLPRMQRLQTPVSGYGTTSPSAFASFGKIVFAAAVVTLLGEMLCFAILQFGVAAWASFLAARFKPTNDDVNRIVDSRFGGLVALFVVLPWAFFYVLTFLTALIAGKKASSVVTRRRVRSVALGIMFAMAAASIPAAIVWILTGVLYSEPNSVAVLVQRSVLTFGQVLFAAMFAAAPVGGPEDGRKGNVATARVRPASFAACLLGIGVVTAVIVGVHATNKDEKSSSPEVGQLVTTDRAMNFKPATLAPYAPVPPRRPFVRPSTRPEGVPSQTEPGPLRGLPSLPIPADSPATSNPASSDVSSSQSAVARPAQHQPNKPVHAETQCLVCNSRFVGRTALAKADNKSLDLCDECRAKYEAWLSVLAKAKSGYPLDETDQKAVAEFKALMSANFHQDDSARRRGIGMVLLSGTLGSSEWHALTRGPGKDDAALGEKLDDPDRWLSGLPGHPPATRPAK